MRIELDKSVDAAYIYLTNIGQGEVKWTYPCNPLEVKGMINLDFNKNGVLIGINVLDASNKLPQEILAQAELLGGTWPKEE